MKNPNEQLSKFLSFVLRHRPDSISIELDKAGWVSVDDLIAQCNAHGTSMTREALEEIVNTDAKGRYSFSGDGQRIRANQGHSLNVELGYRPQKPPDVLYHGTVQTTLDAIKKKGLLKMRRHHVHLSPDVETAKTVGARRGKPVVLKIDSARMDRDNHKFFLSDNGVWLVDTVPPEYIEVMQ